MTAPDTSLDPTASASSIHGIDPDLLGRKVIGRITGSPDSSRSYLNDPVFSFYNIGRRLPNDPHWGEVLVSDVIGCNYRCAHCWVSTDALNGSIGSAFLKKKNSQLPKEFRGNTLQDADAIFSYLLRKSESMPKRIFAFTGGETSLYRGGLKRVGELAQNASEKVHIGIDTDGYLIATQPEYLSAWDGLQDTFNLYVSIKGHDAASFQRFTSVNGKAYDTPFVAIETLLKHGFKTIPGGVVLNTIAHHDNPVEVAEQLQARLSSIHPDLPRLLSYHAISWMVHDRKAVSKRLKSRDYISTKPSDTRDAIVKTFERLKTPIVDVASGCKPGILSKNKILEHIIADLKQ